MEKVIVFDLGGTLMEFEGMPLSWLPYYPQGFAAVDQALSLGLSQEEIDGSVQILKEYNPRYTPREEEISPEKSLVTPSNTGKSCVCGAGDFGVFQWAVFGSPHL